MYIYIFHIQICLNIHQLNIIKKQREVSKKNLLKDIKMFLKMGKKSENMVANDVKIFQSMKNKHLLKKQILKNMEK